MEPTRVALVTGAVGGLGTPIAAGLAQAGFRLALSDRAALVPAAAMAAPVGRRRRNRPAPVGDGRQPDRLATTGRHRPERAHGRRPGPPGALLRSRK